MIEKSNKKPLKNQKIRQVCGQLKKPNLLKYIEKQPKTSQNNLFSAVFMVGVSQPQLNTLWKSAINPYGKRSFRTFLCGKNFEKNVKSYIKTTSKMALFEIWDFHFKGAKT